MIKAILEDKKPGKKLLILGLSLKNLSLLTQDKPIGVSDKTFLEGITDILIMYGETEGHIAQKLNNYIGPKTKKTL